MGNIVYPHKPLLEQRKILLIGDINEFTVKETIQDLLLLNHSNEDVYLYICSAGGYVDPGMALVQTMNAMSYDINTIVAGSCCSMAAVIATCGTKGKRWIYKDSTMMFHRAQDTMEGTAEEIKLCTKELEKIERIINALIVKQTGQKMSRIKKDIQNADFWLSPKTAIEYGAVDGMWNKTKEKKSNNKTKQKQKKDTNGKTTKKR